MRFEFKTLKPAPHFAEIPAEKWSNWIWQMQQTLNTEADFSKVFELNEGERGGFGQGGKLFKVSATPYYSSLGASCQSIRRTLLPTGLEVKPGAQQMEDPLAEIVHSPTSRIIHRYSDRVLFLVTDTCSVYCRYCTRKRFTGQEEGLINRQDYQNALQYIRNHKGIREVILSGGDPLTLSNRILGQTLRDIRAIENIEIIRIGSKMPAVCPMRVDKELIATLKEYSPVYMMTHFSHPKELTKEAADALGLLVDHGIPIFNQTVLLNGINNHAAIIQALSRRLLYLRVKPYYIFQCDPSEGTDHLRTSIESSEKIVKELWGHLSGLAMPTLSLDIPSGGGKTTLVPNFLEKSSEGLREYRGWDGRRGIYKNPEGEEILPPDVGEYFEEWEVLKRAKTPCP